MPKSLTYPLVARTGALVAIAALLVLFLDKNGFLYQLTRFDASFLLTPLLYVLALLYIASLVELFFVGTFAKGLSQNISAFAVLFFLLSMISIEIKFQGIQAFSFWFLLGIVAALLYRTVKIASSEYPGDPLRVISRSVTILFEGVILSNMIYSFIPSSQFGATALAAGVFVSFVSLFGVLSGSSDPYLSYAGQKIGGSLSLFLVSLLAVLVLSLGYFGAFVNALTFGYLPLGVLAFVAVATLLTYRDVRNYARSVKFEDSRLFNYAPYIQGVTKDPERAVEMSNILSDFVGTGSKEKITPYLVSILLERGLSEWRVAMISQDLARYTDLEPPRFMTGSTRRGVEAWTKRRRASALRETLDEVVLSLQDLRSSRQVPANPLQQKILRV